MRVIVASSDEEAAGWVHRVLGSAGLSVAVLPDANAVAPELAGGDLLIADSGAASRIGGAGPRRRILLVPRGHVVDVTSAMAGGFMDLVIVPSSEEDLLSRVGRALDRFLKPARAAPGSRARVDELRDVVDRVVKALRRGAASRAGGGHSLAEEMLSVFLLMIDSHETAEGATPGHSKRAATIAHAMALRLDMTSEEASWMELAGRLHDLGLVPLEIPLKDPAPLTDETRRRMAEHPRLAAEILEPLADWGLPVEAILHHHERVDGSGYPGGLEGDDLSIQAQILGAADVFEALTASRPWRGPETKDGALRAMRDMKCFSAPVLEALRAAIVEGPSAGGGLPALA